MPEGTTDDAGNSDGVQFTPEQQAVIDKIVKDRLKRQREQLLDPNDPEVQSLRQKAEQYDAIEEASKDDLEKAQTEIARLNDALAAANAEKEQLTAKTRELTVKQAVINEAAKAQFGEQQNTAFIDPEDAYLRLDKDAIEFDDDGQPVNVSALVSKVAETKPHLLGAREAPAPSLDGGVRETSTDRADLTPEQAHSAWIAERI